MFYMNVGHDPIKLGENWLLLHLMLVMVYCDFVRSVFRVMALGALGREGGPVGLVCYRWAYFSCV